MWPELDSLDLSGKEVVLYGLGDQQGILNGFRCDGLFTRKLIQRGARLSGYWPTQGYEFEASQALTPMVTPLWVGPG